MPNIKFAGNNDVNFADVNLSEIDGGHSAFQPYSPGAGGWPTIRYFNKETGKDGAPYEKKTDKAMCDELGDLGKIFICSAFGFAVSVFLSLTKLLL